MNLGETGAAYIVNEEGQIIGDKDMENIVKGVNVYEMYPDSKSRDMYEKVIGGETGSQKISLHNTPHYVAYSPVPGISGTHSAKALSFFFSVLAKRAVPVRKGFSLS